jgi:hypothetical protein
MLDRYSLNMPKPRTANILQLTPPEASEAADWFLKRLLGADLGSFNAIDTRFLYGPEPPLRYEKLLHKLKKNIFLQKLLFFFFDQEESTSDNKPPQLVGEFNGHNIVVYKSLFFGINQKLGPINLQEIANLKKFSRKTPGFFIAASKPQILDKIKKNDNTIRVILSS